MASIHFFIIMLITWVVLLIVLRVKKLDFADVMAAVMTMGLALLFDMIVCKELHMYYYISQEHKGFYTALASLLIYPPICILYLKSIPNRKRLTIGILIWTIFLTLVELLYAKPTKVVVYATWDIIPWSPVVYILSFLWIYWYHQMIKKYIAKICSCMQTQ